MLTRLSIGYDKSYAQHITQGARNSRTGSEAKLACGGVCQFGTSDVDARDRGSCQSDAHSQPDYGGRMSNFFGYCSNIRMTNCRTGHPDRLPKFPPNRSDAYPVALSL